MLVTKTNTNHIYCKCVKNSGIEIRFIDVNTICYKFIASCCRDMYLETAQCLITKSDVFYEHVNL